jgi:hypothetical protein
MSKPTLKLSSPFEDQSPDSQGDSIVDTTTEWEKLKRNAHESYPSKLVNQATDGLNPKQRLAAYAYVLNWSTSKIAKESGLKEGTIKKWLKDPRVSSFIDAVRYQRGEKPVEEYYKAQAFSAARMLVDAMNNEGLSIQVRLKAAQTITERGIGKVQDVPTSNDKPATLKDILKQLQIGTSQVQIEEISGECDDR